MNRIPQNVRGVKKTATQYPAIVVDAHGRRASARLSGNGATIHNLRVVGGPVDIGEEVHVDYTTPEPTIVAMAKSWATMDDLLRALKKIPVIEVPQEVKEMDKIALFCLEEPGLYDGKIGWLHSLYDPSEDGFGDAQGTIYNDFDDLGYWRRWAIRLPPAGVKTPIHWTLRGIDIWVPCHIFGDPIAIIDMDSLEPSCVGVSFENIFFHAMGNSSSWPTHTVWGGAMYHAEYDDDPPYDGIPTPLGDRLVFRNCKFMAYNDTDDEIMPTQYPAGTRWIDYTAWGFDERDKDDHDPDVEIVFENCEFYIRGGWTGALIWHYNADWDDLPYVSYYENPTFDTFYYINCYVDALGSEFGGNVPFDNGAGIGALYHVYSCDTIYKNCTDLSLIANCTFLDTSDRSPIDHDHAGVPDSHAFHTDVAGEF